MTVNNDIDDDSATKHGDSHSNQNIGGRQYLHTISTNHRVLPELYEGTEEAISGRAVEASEQARTTKTSIMMTAGQRERRTKSRHP